MAASPANTPPASTLIMNASPARPTTTLALGTDRGALERAGRMLADGALVAFPTETVYGLGADATSPEAIARLYAAKGRPSFNPLIAHVPSIEAALPLGLFSPDARALAEAFWPGPLTLVVPASEASPVCELARAGLPSVAIRVPDHAVAREILRFAARPIAAPSANRSGRISPTLADHVHADLDGIIDAMVDGGPTPVGVESTIVGCLDGEVTMLRPGGISREAIEAVLGKPLTERSGDEQAPLAPGQLSSHYAPENALRLGATRIRPGEGATPALSLNLSESGDLAEAAANLYRHLRALDQLATAGIAAAPIPATGIGEAIMDRLTRAAAPKG